MLRLALEMSWISVRRGLKVNLFNTLNRASSDDCRSWRGQATSTHDAYRTERGLVDVLDHRRHPDPLHPVDLDTLPRRGIGEEADLIVMQPLQHDVAVAR